MSTFALAYQHLSPTMNNEQRTTNKMLSRPLGQTGLTVPIIGLGAGHIGSPHLSDSHVDALLNTALDNGLTLIDTARSYDLSERRIGHFAKRHRDKLVLSTKVGYGVDGVEDWSYQAVEKGIDEALTALQTDHIDIVLLHSCSLGTLQVGEATRALLDAKSAGKIRLAGYSGENEALGWAVESGQFDVIECSVNICDQRSIAWQVESASKRGMGVIAKRPIANAPWRFAEVPLGDYAEEYWWRWKTMNINRQGLEKLETAIRFAAFTKGVSSCIVGTSREDHLLQTLNAVKKGALPDDLYRHIRAAFHSNDPGWWVGEV